MYITVNVDFFSGNKIFFALISSGNKRGKTSYCQSSSGDSLRLIFCNVNNGTCLFLMKTDKDF